LGDSFFTLFHLQQQGLRTPEERTRVLGIIQPIMEEIFAEADFGRQRFELAMNRVEISPAAIFFLYEDPSGQVNRIRDQVRRKLFPRMLEILGKDLYEALEPKIPSIIHSTFVRFTGRAENPQGLHAGLAAVAGEWVPTRVEVTSVCLALEDIPYMHVAHDAKQIVALLQLE